jgi:isocitrate dehydrogenase (NAD+)
MLRGLLRSRALATQGRGLATESTEVLRATLFPGDGIGPEIADAVTLVLRTAGVPVQWDVQVVNPDKPDPRASPPRRRRCPRRSRLSQ